MFLLLLVYVGCVDDVFLVGDVVVGDILDVFVVVFGVCVVVVGDIFLNDDVLDVFFGC